LGENPQTNQSALQYVNCIQLKNSVAGGGKINPDYLKKLKPKRGIKTTFQVKQGKSGRTINGSDSSLEGM
jgi:hypothetical protein